MLTMLFDLDLSNQIDVYGIEFAYIKQATSNNQLWLSFYFDM